MLSPFLPDLAAPDLRRRDPDRLVPGQRCGIRPASVQHMIEISLIDGGDRSPTATHVVSRPDAPQVAALTVSADA